MNPLPSNIEAYPFKTEEECHALIRLIEEWQRTTEVFMSFYSEAIFKRMPTVLTIEGSVVEDAKALNTLAFHLRYMRERVILRLYELKQEDQGPRLIRTEEEVQ
jgi:hypothetical protein